jgi:3-deoxy-D-manno-octulosonate 8-phosphate phosphatase (KDO 8-P phosphatase)
MMSANGDDTTSGLAQRASEVKLLVLDADGVLTDGGLLYGPEGQIYQRFDVTDGYGIRCAMDAGVEVAILTGRMSGAVAARAKTLSIERIVQGSSDKAAAITELARECGVALTDVCFMGDDVFDIPAMAVVGLPAAPANARDEVKAVAAYTCRARGGAGAVREVVELLLSSRGAWPPPGTLPSAKRS